MSVKITETHVSCSMCNRPLNPENGPEEKHHAVMQATIRLNSLRAREIDTVEFVKNLERDLKNRLKQVQADVLRADLKKVQEEIIFLTDFIKEQDPWWIRS